MSNAGHTHHTASKVPEPRADESAVAYGKRVHRIFGESTCECPRSYSMCRWITYHQKKV